MQHKIQRLMIVMKSSMCDYGSVLFRLAIIIEHHTNNKDMHICIKMYGAVHILE